MNLRKVHKQVEILGIKVDSTSKEGVLREIQSRLAKKHKFYIVTPNPEQVVMAQEDDVFLKVLNSADLSLPDGIGLVAAHKFLSLPATSSRLLNPFLCFTQGLGVGFSVIFDQKWLTSDFTPLRGREIFMELVKIANKKRWKIFLLGGWDKVAERTKLVLEKNYKTVKIKAGTGPVLDDNGTPITDKEEVIEKEIVKEINQFDPDLLFVGFRAPSQEKWLHKWLQDLSIGGGMVVGGTFNYVSGKYKSPPSFIANMGFEWLWRLFTGSQKKERVIKAFPKFPLKIFWQKLLSNS